MHKIAAFKKDVQTVDDFKGCRKNLSKIHLPKFRPVSKELFMNLLKIAILAVDIVLCN